MDLNNLEINHLFTFAQVHRDHLVVPTVKRFICNRETGPETLLSYSFRVVCPDDCDTISDGHANQSYRSPEAAVQVGRLWLDYYLAGLEATD